MPNDHQMLEGHDMLALLASVTPMVPLTYLGKNYALVDMTDTGLHRLQRSYSRIEVFLFAKGENDRGRPKT